VVLAEDGDRVVTNHFAARTASLCDTPEDRRLQQVGSERSL